MKREIGEKEREGKVKIGRQLGRGEVDVNSEDWGVHKRKPAEITTMVMLATCESSQHCEVLQFELVSEIQCCSQ